MLCWEEGDSEILHQLLCCYLTSQRCILWEKRVELSNNHTGYHLGTGTPPSKGSKDGIKGRISSAEKSAKTRRTCFVVELSRAPTPAPALHDWFFTALGSQYGRLWRQPILTNQRREFTRHCPGQILANHSKAMARTPPGLHELLVWWLAKCSGGLGSR